MEFFTTLRSVFGIAASPDSILNSTAPSLSAPEGRFLDTIRTARIALPEELFPSAEAERRHHGKMRMLEPDRLDRLMPLIMKPPGR